MAGAAPATIRAVSAGPDYTRLPPDLPAPADDGAADHLQGMVLPELELPSTGGGRRGLRTDGGLLVAYIYPRTGVPGEPPIAGWDDIPGARGCTPQSCAYRDSLAEFERLGADLIGVSAQSPAEQGEFAEREQIPFPLLSDAGLALAKEPLHLPTFEAAGLRLYRRLTLVAEAGRIVKAFYPVFPPDRDAASVLAWLGSRAGG
jgi:peroxiredoxin